MRFFENTRKPQGFGGKLMTKMMNSGHAKLSQWGFSNISTKSDAEVLDVGCGGGANIAVWLDRCRNGHVTGMDYSEVSVAKSQKLNALAIKQGKCNVVQGDVSAIPFSDATFDYVSAFETVYFWPGLVKCFSEVNRVLKSEGIFLILSLIHIQMCIRDSSIVDIPEDMQEDAELYHTELIEKICELDDDLMMEYLEGDEPSVDRLKAVLRKATCECTAVPVCCGSAYRNKGVQKLLDAIVEYMPAPTDIPAIKGVDLDGNEVERHSSDDEPFSALAFKIMTDPRCV